MSRDVDIIGKAIAGCAPLARGGTLADKRPHLYDNPLTDYVMLVIAEVKAKQSLKQQLSTPESET